MKIRIKETDEVLEDVKFIETTFNKITIKYLDDGVLRNYSIKNLSDIEEVKDYEEPKVFWYIYGDQVLKAKCDGVIESMNKPIGNYFETEEEAEKAVEKLKAWKRLRDYNVKFNLDFVRNRIDFTYSINNTLVDVLDGEEQIFNNMKIIFGGEE